MRPSHLLVVLLIAAVAAGTAVAAGEVPAAGEEEASADGRPRRDAPPDEDRLDSITRHPRPEAGAGEQDGAAETGPEAQATEGVTRAAEPHGARAGVVRTPGEAEPAGKEAPEAEGAPLESAPDEGAAAEAPGGTEGPAELAGFPEVDDLLVLSRRAAVAADPHSAAAWVDLGNAYAEDYRPDTALSAYERALAIEPSFAPALNNRCGVLLSENRDKDALPACQAAVEADPHSAVSQYLVGIAYDRQSQYQAAMDHYQAALTINPRFKLASVNPNIINNRHLQILNLRLYQAKGGSMVLPLQPGSGP